jgi:zinc protease
MDMLMVRAETRCRQTILPSTAAMMPRISIVALLASASFVSAADPTADAALAAKVKANFDAIRTETLPNGLRVYMLPIPSSPIVTAMMAYKVGAGDEDKTATGLSHYLEHLLFKGTDKLNPGDIDRLTQRNGGSNNAYTNEDMTVYHFDFAADRWMIGLEIEADRMRNTRIDKKHEFEQEKGAVISELKRNEDGPWDLEYKTILPLLFPKESPYSHPVIGEEGHVRGASAEVITRYYDRWYHPNNASLVIVGGFDPDAAMAKIKTLFGPIPKGDLPERKPSHANMARGKTVRAEFKSKFDVPRALIGFNTVKVGDPEDYVLDVIDGILAGGKTGRLYKTMVEGERIAGAIAASNSTGRYPGWYGVNVELLPGKDRKRAEQLVFTELAKLAKEPVAADELARVKRQLLADYVFKQEDVHALCDTIARAVTFTDLDYAKTFLTKVLAVTPADIQRVAAKYLVESEAAIVWSIPEDEAGGKAVPVPPKPNRHDRRLYRNAVDSPVGVAGPDLTKAKRTVLPNGLTVIALENRRLPIVVADAYVSEVRLREPAAQGGIANLASDLFSEGTPTRTGEQISELIENTGGSLNFSSNGGSLKVLTSDAELGFDLLFDCMMRPTFPQDKFQQYKDQQLATIADMDTRPNVKARKLFAATVYGDHPFGRPSIGTKETVEKLTPADCKAFHTASVVPNRTTLVVVGDIDAQAITDKIAKWTADWKPNAAELPVLPAFPVADKPISKVVTMANASQTNVFVGHLGIKRSDPDYYTLLVMDNVLGTGPGFTDRLSSSLRDRQGLAYTVNASITSSAGENTGTFTGFIGTFPDKFIWVRDGFLKEINRIRDEPASEQEVEDAKRYLLGSLAFKLTTNDTVAGQLLTAERNKLGFDFLNDYRKKVAAVTVADVQAAAKKHLDPKKIAVIAVGPIDANGKPLPAKTEKE